LRRVADDVLAALRPRQEAGIGDDAWGLHPGTWGCGNGQEIDLSGLSLECDSAWVPLAGGLIAAALRDGCRLRDAQVWATGCWDPENGIRSVGGIEVKLRTAAAFGARVVFVPEANQDEARTIASGLQPALDVRALRMGTCDPWKALEAYRLRLELPPSADDPFPDRRDFYLRQPNDDERTRQFYEASLLPDLIESASRQVRRRWDDWRPDHLVTVVSAGSLELVPLEVGALRPRHVWLVHTADFREKLGPVRDRLRRLFAGMDQPVVVHDEPGFRDVAELLQGLPARLATCLGDSGSRVLDVTLGTAAMTLRLAGLGRPAQDHVIYWHHTMRERRVIPGSQRLVKIPSQGEWELTALSDSDADPATGSESKPTRVSSEP
jgi:hypothetical protein